MPAPPRWYCRTVVLLLLLHGGMLVALAALNPVTTDEPAYIAAGQAIREHHSWEMVQTRFHGPLALLANQLFADWCVPVEPLRDFLFWARLGMMPFALICAGMLALMARRACGPTVAVIALALHCLNPLVLANGYLVTADMALTCATIMLLYAMWRYFETASMARLVALAAALAFALATKYLALLLIPALAISVVLATARGFAPRILWSRKRTAAWARFADLLPATLICVAVALPLLHTFYLWSPGGYHVAAGPSDPMAAHPAPLSGWLRAAVEWPGVPSLLQLLPEPLVQGIDFQKLQSETTGTKFLGNIAAGHPAYYVVALGVKLPLVFLLLLGFGLLLRRHRLPPTLAIVIWPAIAVLLVYLSLFSQLQIGVRYILPVTPLLALLAARGGEGLLRRGRFGRTVAVTALLWLLACHAITWPRYPSAFNLLAGERPYLLFTDSTLDWGGTGPDRAEVERRHPQATQITDLGGPRLGELYVFGHFLGPADPRNPQRVYHWLRRFHPIDRVGGWFVFDVTAESFAGAVGAESAAPDARGMTEWAVALACAGQPQRALQVLDGVEDPDVGSARQLAQLVLTGDTATPTYLESLLVWRRYDLVLASAAATPLQRATAHFRRVEATDVIKVLLPLQRERRLSSAEALLLASAQHAIGEDEAALAVFDTLEPVRSSPTWPVFDQLRREMVGRVAYRQRLEGHGITQKLRW